MATFDYAGLATDVKAILEEFGNPLTLSRSANGANGAYDPATGTYAAGTDTILSGIGVLVGYKKDEINGDTVLATDRKLLFQGDLLEIGDKYKGWRVYDKNDIDPPDTGLIVLTIAQMRK